MPFAKTGGLADVTGSLPQALNNLEQNIKAAVIMPKYGLIQHALKDKIKHIRYIFITVAGKSVYCGIEKAEYKGVSYYFIDNEYYFKRDGLYGYGDDPERFAFFCKAVLEAVPFLDFLPDILHCNDWQTGMIPLLLNDRYKSQSMYKNISVIFTVHNLQYQGVFDIERVKNCMDLNDRYFNMDGIEFYGGASFMKAGLIYSDLITTVSPGYADEIQEKVFGERLDGLLRARKDKLFGILNGIDYKDYDPESDIYLVKRYNKDSLELKKENKSALQLELNMPQNRDIAVIGLISRLTSQKGLDLIEYAMHDILKEDLQFYVLGTGDEKFERFFKDVAYNNPERVSANIRFDNVLAHRIYASSDIFLMPSLFEPCGLGQLIAMRYGSLPVVRETGGLKNTVFSYNESTGEGNGFSFREYNAHDMLFTIKRALDLYKDKKTWEKIQIAAMSSDYSWHSSATKYVELYNKLKGI